nr:hypothetical protein [uncultured bacterium]
MNSITRPLSDDSILQLFNLTSDTVQSIDFETKYNELHIDITLSVKEHTCPVCSNITRKIKGYTRKKILHTVITHLPCYINYKARRYQCTMCKKTFNEHNPFAYRNMKLSALTVSNVLDDLKKANETFSTVASRYRISTTTACALFDSHVSISRKLLPHHLLIDEVYAFKSYNSDYACVLVDALSMNTIDILPSRKQLDLLSYFRQIPLEERERVQTVGMDMWMTYRNVSKAIFPNAKCSVDKFHVFQDFYRRLDQLRVSIMNEIKPPHKWRDTLDKVKYHEYLKRDERYYLLKKFNWILMKNSRYTTKVDGIEYTLLDPNIPKRFNSKLNRYCNYLDLLEAMLDLCPELSEGYILKRKLEAFYEKSSSVDAKRKLEELIDDMHISSIKSFREFSNTLRQWKQEIINSFELVEKRIKVVSKDTGEITYETQMIKINNALIENRNRIIKQIKNNSSGYTNWERFRNRVLYVLNPDATYRIYQPEIDEKRSNSI